MSQEPTWLKVVTTVCSIIGAAGVLIGVGVYFGDVRGRLEDIRERLVTLEKEVRPMGVQLSLLRQKVNDEVIPRLNGDPKIQRISRPIIPVPVPVTQAVSAKIISHDEYTRLPRDSQWVIAYRTSRPKEPLERVVSESAKLYGQTASPDTVWRVNNIRDPQNVSEGTRVIIPLKELRFSEAPQWQEKLDLKVHTPKSPK